MTSQFPTFPLVNFKYAIVNSTIQTSYPYPWYSSPYTVYPGETFQVSVGAVGETG